MILISGASGTTGREIVKQLAALGEPVVALVRDFEKARMFRGMCVRVAEGNLDAPATLGPAFHGIHAALLLPANSPAQVQQEKNFIDAARAAGVRHVVKLSAVGADASSPARIARWHGESERYLEASGVAWTHLRPSGFMQNILGQAASIAARGEFYGTFGESKQSMIDVGDIAAVAVKALTTPGHEGRIYTLSGPEALSYAEAAGRMSRILGKPVRYVDVPPEPFKANLEKSGMPAWLAEALLELIEHVIVPKGAQVTETVREVTGRPATSFERFVEANASAFRGA